MTTRLLRAISMTLLLAAILVPVPRGDATALPQEGLVGPAEGESLADWAVRWMDGAPGVIATGEERELWRELSTTQERLQFIRLFWQRRDPRLRGPRNEFLDEFSRRLEYVTENYSNPGRPAWETVFGRVVMLFGIPDRVRREIGGLPDELSDRPPILWSYDRRLPELSGNEDLLFVFQRGRWRLLPPSPIGETGVGAQIRAAERASSMLEVPSDYEIAMDAVIEELLVNPVNYRSIPDSVRTEVALPEAQIPFGWETRFAAGREGRVRVEVELAWRIGSLVFHRVDDEFETDMVVDVELLDGAEPVAAASETFTIRVPEGEIGARQEEVVRRTIELGAEPGSYRLEIVLLDQLLGYRTVYGGEVEVPSL